MNLAEKAKSVIDGKGFKAISLYAGQAITYDGETVHFPQGVVIHTTTNSGGRITLARYKYADDSVLEYRYSVKTETFKLTVERKMEW